MPTNTVQYSKACQSMAVIESVLNELATTFSSVQQRTTVDEAMIDALVAAANALSTSATALKSITYTPPAP